MSGQLLPGQQLHDERLPGQHLHVPGNAPGTKRRVSVNTVRIRIGGKQASKSIAPQPVLIHPVSQPVTELPQTAAVLAAETPRVLAMAAGAGQGSIPSPGCTIPATPEREALRFAEAPPAVAGPPMNSSPAHAPSHLVPSLVVSKQQTAQASHSRTPAEKLASGIQAIASIGDVFLGGPSGGSGNQRPPRQIFNKTMAAVVTFCLLMLLPEWVTQLEPYKLFDVVSIPEVWDMPIAPPPPVESGPSKAALQAMLDEALGPVNPYLYADDGALDHFFAALRDRRTVRVVHFGDSPTTADLITADARKLLQADYGNAGEGFVLIARPWAWYNHRGVAMESRNWGIDVAGYANVKDGLYGLGGARFRGFPGSTASWTVYGDRPQSVEVSYLTQPGGGTFVLEADGQEVGTVDTSLDPATGLPIEVSEEDPTGGQHPAFTNIQLPGGGKEVTLRVMDGIVKVFGVEFRNNRPGVIYSSLGINGASVTVLSRTFSNAHLSAQLRHYRPDLVVLAYGTNESGFPTWVQGTWGNELRAAIRRVKQALPEASILLMSPMDRGEVKPDGRIGTVRAMPQLVEIEKRVAAEEGVAFFNTFEAMGGVDTMARWYQGSPRLVGADFIHPLPAGAKIVGELLYGAIQDGYTGYDLRKRREELLGEASPPPASRRTASPRTSLAANEPADPAAPAWTKPVTTPVTTPASNPALASPTTRASAVPSEDGSGAGTVAQPSQPLSKPPVGIPPVGELHAEPILEAEFPTSQASVLPHSQARP